MKAFTLLETALSISILIFIFFSLFFLVINVSNLSSFSLLQTGTEGRVLLNLKIMEKELKSMETSNLGGYPIEEASSTKIVFYSDIDNDNLIEKISYSLIEEKLEKKVIKPTGNPLTYNENFAQISYVLDNLITPQKLFSFYDNNFEETNDISKIRLIKIDIKINQGRKIFSSYLFVAPRNLKDK